MEKLLKEYLFIFLVIIFSVGILFIVLVQGLKGGIEDLEQLYLSLFLILALLLVMIIVGVILFLILAFKNHWLKRDTADYPSLSQKEIRKMGKQERQELLQRLKEERDEVQQMIELTKNKFYQRELDGESFRELIRDYEKKLIEVESNMNKIKNIS